MVLKTPCPAGQGVKVSKVTNRFANQSINP